MLIHFKRGILKLSKEDDHSSLLAKLKNFLHIEPKTKEELITLLRDAQMRSLIDVETLTMIEAVIQFAPMRVRDIMLPKQQMTCIPHNTNMEQIIEIITTSGHSRFPVIGNNKNEIIGILHAKDLLRFQSHSNGKFDINDVIRTATLIPESKRLDALLSEFRHTRNHMAIVVDEYGAVSGIVTIEDIIEQIVGDIEDEFDINEEEYIKAHVNSYYIVKAHTPIEEFNEQMNTNFSEEYYDTIGGIVMTNFGYLPKKGETITINQFEFKVINADARRIKLLGCLDKRPTKNKLVIPNN